MSLSCDLLGAGMLLALIDSLLLTSASYSGIHIPRDEPPAREVSRHHQTKNVLLLFFLGGTFMVRIKLSRLTKKLVYPDYKFGKMQADACNHRSRSPPQGSCTAC